MWGVGMWGVGVVLVGGGGGGGIGGGGGACMAGVEGGVGGWSRGDKTHFL